MKLIQQTDITASRFGIEKAMDELGDKITEEQKSEVTTKITAVKDAINEKNVEKVKTTQKDLEDVCGPIINSIYSSQAPNDDAMSQFNNMFGGGNNANDNPFAGANFDAKNNPFAK